MAIKIKKKPMSIASQEKMVAVVKLYKKGKCLREIGEIYGLTRERIRQILNESGCKRRRFTRTELVTTRKKKPKIILDKTVLENLYYEKTVLLKDIANYFGVTLLCVNYNLKEYGFSRPSMCIVNPLLTTERLKYEYLELNKTAKEIAEIYGYAEGSISVKLLRANIKRPHHQPLFDRETLKHLYLGLNKSAGEIGEMFGVSRGIVNSYCQKYALKKGKGKELLKKKTD